MKCPNCKKEMKKTVRYEDRIRPYESFWTEDYIVRVTRHSCKNCKIKCIQESDSYDIEWILPTEFKPSEKQVEYAKIISDNLGIDIDDLVTKQQYWAFINNHVR